MLEDRNMYYGRTKKVHVTEARGTRNCFWDDIWMYLERHVGLEDEELRMFWNRGIEKNIYKMKEIGKSMEHLGNCEWILLWMWTWGFARRRASEFGVWSSSRKQWSQKKEVMGCVSWNSFLEKYEKVDEGRQGWRHENPQEKEAEQRQWLQGRK